MSVFDIEIDDIDDKDSEPIQTEPLDITSPWDSPAEERIYNMLVKCYELLEEINVKLEEK